MKQEENELSLTEGAVKVGRLVTGPTVLVGAVGALSSPAWPAFIALGVIAAGVTYYAKSRETELEEKTYQSYGKKTKFLVNGARAIAATVGGALGLSMIAGSASAVSALPVASLLGADIGPVGHLGAFMEVTMAGLLAYHLYKNKEDKKILNETINQDFVVEKEISGDKLSVKTILNNMKNIREKCNIDNLDSNNVKLLK